MNTKTIITAILLLFSLTSFAQTKEQTIAWIKEKLEKHGGGNNNSLSSTYVSITYVSITYVNVKVSPCRISYTRKYSDEEGGTRYSFNPSTAKSWKVSDNKNGIQADAAIICEVLKSDTSDNIDYLAIRNGGADIHERMIKALLHLATFCDEGKNEAF